MGVNVTDGSGIQPRRWIEGPEVHLPSMVSSSPRAALAEDGPAPMLWSPPASAGLNHA